MEATAANYSFDLKRNPGSTETLDGLSDIDVDVPSPQRKFTNSMAWAIIFVIIFLIWALFFLGVTIYKIRALDRDVELVKDAVAIVTIKTVKIEPLGELIPEHNPCEIKDSTSIKSEPNVEPTTEEINQTEDIESKEVPLSFRKSPNLAERFEDVKYEQVSDNCYRKDFLRTNILGTGTDCRFIVKSSRIPLGASNNKGKCASSYYWIYTNPQKKQTRVYTMGPYYGDHSVDMTEALFDQEDKAGSFTLFGCAPPLGPFTSSFNLKDKEYYFMNEKATITPESYKFNDLKKFEAHLKQISEKELDEYHKSMIARKHDEESVATYTTLKETTVCLNSL